MNSVRALVSDSVSAEFGVVSGPDLVTASRPQLGKASGPELGTASVLNIGAATGLT